MNTNQSAKEQVLSWVRSKNPQTLELKVGTKLFLRPTPYSGKSPKLSQVCECSDISWWRQHKDKILGSDMGLQELWLAFERSGNIDLHIEPDGTIKQHKEWDMDSITLKKETIGFDLTKNLHEQSEEFFQAILPLISA